MNKKYTSEKNALTGWNRLLVGAALALLIGQAAGGQTAPVLAHAAPNFALKDDAGKNRTLQEYRKRPVVLFFFCSCENCHRIAEMWGQAQKAVPAPEQTAKNGGAKAATLPPVTLFVFAGEADEARAFREQTGLDAAQTVALADPDMKIALAYDAIPCPRVFALDAAGIIRYTNRDPKAKDSVIEPATVVSRLADTLQTLAKSKTNNGAKSGAGKLKPAPRPQKPRGEK